MCLAIVYKCREHRPAAAAASPCRARPRTDAEEHFFLKPVTLTPPWMRSMFQRHISVVMCQGFVEQCTAHLRHSNSSFPSPDKRIAVTYTNLPSVELDEQMVCVSNTKICSGFSSSLRYWHQQQGRKYYKMGYPTQFQGVINLKHWRLA